MNGSLCTEREMRSKKETQRLLRARETMSRSRENVRKREYIFVLDCDEVKCVCILFFSKAMRACNGREYYECVCMCAVVYEAM